MKFNCYYSFLAAAALCVGFTACSDDDYSLGDVSVTPEQLVEGQSFTVTPTADNPNVIRLTSKVKGATALWVTPQGRSQSSDFTIDLPFAGEYEVTFGVMTSAGPVYGDPYKFTVGQNDFSMLSDDIWTNLAGGVDENGNGNPKKWVVNDMCYLDGGALGPVMYMSPDDYKDPEFGRANWSPNWDPGFQSWLIPEDDPYMDSYMIFGLDPVKGCTLTEYRNTSSGAQEVTGTFSLVTADPKHPKLTFNGGTYSMHNISFDGVCDNYTNDIRILECTPYVLQLATMRTNSEGPWWLVWNFVAADVKDGTVVIPGDGPSLLQPSTVKLPEFDNLERSLFTVVGQDATYVGSQVTYLLNDETPYDYLWWNAATSKWEAQGLYGITMPAYDAVDDWALTLERNGLKATFETPEMDGAKAAFTIDGSKLVFAEPVTFITADNYSVSGTEFQVMDCNPENESLVIGVPAGTDNAGDVNRYLCVNLKPKAIGGGQQGPTMLKFNPDNISLYLSDDPKRVGKLEAALYHPWGGNTKFFEDNSKLKIKKNQSIYITFHLEGVEWNDGASPRCHIDANDFNPEFCDWSLAGFDLGHNTVLNKSGDTTISLANGSGATFAFEGVDCISIGIETDGLVKSPLGDNGLIDVSQVKIVVTSVYIE